jgi:hypothetical protein
MKKTFIAGFCLAVVIIISLVAGFQYFLHVRTTQEISRVIDEVSLVESLGYEKLKVGFWGTRFSLRNVSLRIKGVNELIRTKEISVSNIQTGNGHLLGFNVEIKGIGVPLENTLSDNSYQALDITNPGELISILGCFYQYDPNHKILNLENIKITAPELAAVEASIRLVNVDPSTISLNNPAVSLPHLLGISIFQASVSYDDHSLLGKILQGRDHSKKPGSPGALEVISENVYQMLQKEKDEKTRIILEKVLKFIHNPEKLLFTLSPEKPVPFGRLLWVRHLREFVDLLKVNIEI